MKRTVRQFQANPAHLAPRAQYLYAKRQALEILMGQNRRYIDINLAPLNTAQSQIVKNLQMLLVQTETEIAELLKRTAASRPAAR